MNYRDELLDGDLEFDPEVAGACWCHRRTRPCPTALALYFRQVPDRGLCLGAEKTALPESRALTPLPRNPERLSGGRGLGTCMCYAGRRIKIRPWTSVASVSVVTSAMDNGQLNRVSAACTLSVAKCTGTPLSGASAGWPQASPEGVPTGRHHQLPIRAQNGFISFEPV
jgi:hypothetical protein